MSNTSETPVSEAVLRMAKALVHAAGNPKGSMRTSMADLPPSVLDAPESRNLGSVSPLPIFLAWNPDQPRDPAGSATGGQWTSGGSSGASRAPGERGNVSGTSGATARPKTKGGPLVETPKASAAAGAWLKEDLEAIRAEAQKLREFDEPAWKAYRDFAPEGGTLEQPAGLPLDTFEAHWNDQGPITPQREAETDAIVERAFEGKEPVPEGQQKWAILMQGGPGSGKSTATRGQDEVLASFVAVDPDGVKLQLDEYKRGTAVKFMGAANMVHKESSVIAGMIRDRAIAEGYNVLLDGTGSDQAKMEQLIEKLHAAGYKTDLRYVHVPMHVGLKWGTKRAETSLRKPEPDFVKWSYGALPKAHAAMGHKTTIATIYDSEAKEPIFHRPEGSQGIVLRPDRVARYEGYTGERIGSKVK